MKKIGDTPEVQVHVGRPVEVAFEESKWLGELAYEMQCEARRQRPGWFHRYLVAHRKAHNLVRDIFERSHQLDLFSSEN